MKHVIAVLIDREVSVDHERLIASVYTYCETALASILPPLLLGPLASPCWNIGACRIAPDHEPGLQD